MYGGLGVLSWYSKKFQKDCAKRKFYENEIQLLCANPDLLGSIVCNSHLVVQQQCNSLDSNTVSNLNSSDKIGLNMFTIVVPFRSRWLLYYTHWHEHVKKKQVANLWKLVEIWSCHESHPPLTNSNFGRVVTGHMPCQIGTVLLLSSSIWNPYLKWLENSIRKSSQIHLHLIQPFILWNAGLPNQKDEKPGAPSSQWWCLTEDGTLKKTWSTIVDARRPGRGCGNQYLVRWDRDHNE